MTSNLRAVTVCHDEKEIRIERRVSSQAEIEKNIQRETLQKQAPELPYSVFSSRMKTWIIFLVSISALISPFGATTVLPALNVLTDVLDISPTKANISITTYMVSCRYAVQTSETDFDRLHRQSHQPSLARCQTRAGEGFRSFCATSFILLPTSDSPSRQTTSLCLFYVWFKRLDAAPPLLLLSQSCQIFLHLLREGSTWAMLVQVSCVAQHLARQLEVYWRSPWDGDQSSGFSQYSLAYCLSHSPSFSLKPAEMWSVTDPHPHVASINLSSVAFSNASSPNSQLSVKATAKLMQMPIQ